MKINFLLIGLSVKFYDETKVFKDKLNQTELPLFVFFNCYQKSAGKQNDVELFYLNERLVLFKNSNKLILKVSVEELHYILFN